MSNPFKKWVALGSGLVVLFILAAGLLILRTKLSQPSYVPLRIVQSAPKPPYPEIPLSLTTLSEGEIQKFLSQDSTLVRRVESLPPSVFRAYAERKGLANPGEHFEAYADITDVNVPNKRLIFAGVSGDTCFVYYEQGGSARSYDVALFRPISGKPFRSNVERSLL